MMRILKETLPRNKKYPTPLRVLTKNPKVYRGLPNNEINEFISSTYYNRVSIGVCPCTIMIMKAILILSAETFSKCPVLKSL
jgi:hypothetical protein